MVNVHCTHREVLLVSSSPASSHFEVKLWRRTPWNITVKIRQKVKSLPEAKESALKTIPELFEYLGITRLEIHSEEHLSSSQLILVVLPEKALAHVILLVLSILANSQLATLVSQFAYLKPVVQGMLDTDIHLFLSAHLLQALEPNSRIIDAKLI